MANKFNAGDVVVLKSGGPPMTVDKVPGDRPHATSSQILTEYRCEWFRGATAERGGFGEHVLEIYVPPKK